MPGQLRDRLGQPVLAAGDQHDPARRPGRARRPSRGRCRNCRRSPRRAVRPGRRSLRGTRTRTHPNIRTHVHRRRSRSSPVPDLPETVSFYRDLLDFRESYRFPPEGEPEFVTLKLGTSEIGLGAGEVPGPAAPVTRCASTPTTATGRSASCGRPGTPIVEEPSDTPWGERMARVADPAGNEIVIVARSCRPRRRQPGNRVVAGPCARRRRWARPAGRARCPIGWYSLPSRCRTVPPASRRISEPGTWSHGSIRQNSANCCSSVATAGYSYPAQWRPAVTSASRCALRGRPGPQVGRQVLLGDHAAQRARRPGRRCGSSPVRRRCRRRCPPRRPSSGPRPRRGSTPRPARRPAAARPSPRTASCRRRSCWCRRPGRRSTPRPRSPTRSQHARVGRDRLLADHRRSRAAARSGRG